ncbi:hypothetical protein KF707_19730 [Candidatus Obscuribacterales bacterium]|nr:hypothetical protein [Candidatus Obscuribacterales bacterium]MBX3138468.1 hypothetical protein [Candidatus Obscuribacterales bacterium]MBX3149819.1 hypothetical protein [Candidatus Obscuribacterales bacterium]
MSVTLHGGPLDGQISSALSHLPLYMVATNLEDKPVYKRISCTKCACHQESVKYVFVGYDNEEANATKIIRH